MAEDLSLCLLGIVLQRSTDTLCVSLPDPLEYLKEVRFLLLVLSPGAIEVAQQQLLTLDRDHTSVQSSISTVMVKNPNEFTDRLDLLPRGVRPAVKLELMFNLPGHDIPVSPLHGELYRLLLEGEGQLLNFLDVVRVQS